MTRAEHLAWCKQRAIELLDAGRTQEAFVSMTSDLNKHPETQGHSGRVLGMRLLMSGHLERRDQMREFIKGFN